MCTLDGCGSHEHLGPPPKATDEERRLFLKGAVALPLAVILADPMLAHAAGHGLDKVTITTPEGDEMVAEVAMPTTLPAPTVILIHEWWGLNDHIRAVAAEYAKQGYIALAVDLYGKPPATTPDGARSLMSSMDPAVATRKLQASVEFLRGHKDSTGKVGSVGWCFGGGWSLNTALATNIDAAVIYYGNVKKTPEQVATLNAPIMGHFGTLDKSINREMVEGFEESLRIAGKTDYQFFWYDADHAFANPTGGRYDGEDAMLAWERTMAFFHEHLS
ncbi:MAG: dienelactone hydrolase family protein [Thalassospira sp.]|uniref:dienelactone hydrolase family protein n=1 Tax=Thalassospira sp. TaxID=1912094 RepID=UPI001B10B57D|nr:dienelactone hydrolase family protein [Thalassospira sp.]MBO6578009.1 dienelactone hydrolase family protein [Thalassospira sp.]MBO6804875.1 dienelactone hydrolase family protein [Thalassospira sp.]MBO6818998.1 dienelactone hydrolase family protein [Thalassospira sp.]MBO6889100.1 dienelactone hydrolase family protein [Thalassospira sp.]